MPLNAQKVVSIILEQGEEIEDRCDGYRKEILNVVCDIIEYERQHRVQGTNIQQKINEKCNATGRFLTDERDKNTSKEE